MLNYKMTKQHNTTNRGNNVCNRFSRNKRNEDIDFEDENSSNQESEAYKRRLNGSIALAAVSYSCTCVRKSCDQKK